MLETLASTGTATLSGARMASASLDYPIKPREEHWGRPPTRTAIAAVALSDDFNAVIEGGPKNACRYKLASLPLQGEITAISDNSIEPKDRCILYGRIKNLDGDLIRLGNDSFYSQSQIETEFDSLRNWPGVHLQSKCSSPSKFLDSIRSITMRDGRVFLEKSLWFDRDYLLLLPKVVKIANEMFKDQRYNGLYHQTIDGFR